MHRASWLNRPRGQLRQWDPWVQWGLWPLSGRLRC